MAVSGGFRSQRVTIGAGGALQAVTPPNSPAGHFQSVSIGNSTAGDLRVYTNDDASEYLTIVAGYERTISVRTPHRAFPTTQPAFWLQGDNAGTVIITWT